MWNGPGELHLLISHNSLTDPRVIISPDPFFLLSLWPFEEKTLFLCSIWKEGIAFTGSLMASVKSLIALSYSGRGYRAGSWNLGILLPENSSILSWGWKHTTWMRWVSMYEWQGAAWNVCKSKHPSGCSWTLHDSFV